MPIFARPVERDSRATNRRSIPCEPGRVSRNSANPSLWTVRTESLDSNLETKILRAETRAQNAAPVARLREIRAAETRFDLAKSR